MSMIFFEKAFWGFIALVTSLVAVIYKLFNGSIQKDLKIMKESVKEEMEYKFENKFSKKIDFLSQEILKLRDEISMFKKNDIDNLKNELIALKRHEDNNYSIQNKLLKKVLIKLDSKNPNIVNDILNEDL